MWTSSQIAARLYPRLGPRRIATGSLIWVTAVFCLLGVAVGLDTSVWVIRLLTFCNGFGIGACGIALQSSSFATIASADTGRAAALFQTSTQVAGGIGVALLVTVVSATAPAGATGAALIPAFHNAFLTAGGMIIIGALFALTIRDADAAVTMRREPPAAAATVAPGAAEGTVELG